MVRVKVFPENRYFLEMLFSGKENIFMYLVAFQKMFRTNEGEIAIAISIEIGEITIAIDADQRSHGCADRRGAGDHAMVFGMLADHADWRGAGDHADRSLSLLLSVFCLRGFFSFCGSLSLLHVLQKMFEGKTIL